MLRALSNSVPDAHGCSFVNSEEFIVLEHVDAQHLSKYLYMVFLTVAIFPLIAFGFGIVIYEQQSHNRILINR